MSRFTTSMMGLWVLTANFSVYPVLEDAVTQSGRCTWFPLVAFVFGVYVGGLLLYEGVRQK